MSKLLDKFIKTLPRLQARKIEKELQTEKAKLLYPTSQAFRTALQDQLRELLDNDTLIRFQEIGLIENDLRLSEPLDHMLKTIASDLESLFAETDNILQLEAQQERLFKEEILDKLHKAVDEAEAEILRLELLRGNVSGLKDAIVEKFTSGANRMPRNGPMAGFAYVDPKGNQAFTHGLDMPVGVNVGGLVLPTDIDESSRVSSIKDIQTSDIRDDTLRFALPRAVSPSTDGDVAITGRISNLIDRQRGTFWKKDVDTRELVPGGAKLNLSLNLGASTEINYIEIHPIGNFDQSLSELYYVDPTGTVIEIELQTTPVSLVEPVRIFFKNIEAKHIVCVLKQENSIMVGLGEGLGQGIAPTQRGLHRRYTFALDNILTGKVKYLPVGHYVSKTLSLPNISKLFLAATENSFIGVAPGDPISPVTDPLPPVEYWVSYREIDDSETVVASLYLPILPVGRTTVTEKIEINSFNKGYLSFALDPALLDASGDLLLYKNGTLITRPVDYQFEPAATNLVDRAKLNIPQGYRQEGEYVAVYTPFHTEEGTVPIPFVDATGLVRYDTDNSISIRRPESSGAVRSEANLIIVMRGTGNGTRTSIVDEFTFAVG
jgi:hypothetical protein